MDRESENRKQSREVGITEGISEIRPREAAGQWQFEPDRDGSALEHGDSVHLRHCLIVLSHPPFDLFVRNEVDESMILMIDMRNDRDMK
jgi:hypothetical protein